MENIFWTIKDEDGTLRPMAIISSDKMFKYAKPDFDKLVNRSKGGENLKIVKIKIEEIE